MVVQLISPVSKLLYPSLFKNSHFIIYKPNLIFQHINLRCEKQKGTHTYCLVLFSLGMCAESLLTSARPSLPSKKKLLPQSFFHHINTNFLDSSYHYGKIENEKHSSRCILTSSLPALPSQGNYSIFLFRGIIYESSNRENRRTFIL